MKRAVFVLQSEQQTQQLGEELARIVDGSVVDTLEPDAVGEVESIVMILAADNENARSYEDLLRSSALSLRGKKIACVAVGADQESAERFARKVASLLPGKAVLCKGLSSKDGSFQATFKEVGHGLANLL